MRRRPFVALAAIIVSIAAGGLLVLADLALELIERDPLLEVIDARRTQGLAYDERTKGEVVEDLRARGVDAVPFVIPEFLLRELPDGSLASRTGILPLSGAPSRTTVLCNEGGEFAIFRSDRHGFRNPDEVWERAATDVALIGDSFTMGDCLPDPETISAQLAADGLHVVNLGVAGIGPLYELGILREYASTLRPRVLVWLYCENDLNGFDLELERRVPALVSYLRPGFSQGLAGRAGEVAAAHDDFLAGAAPPGPGTSAAEAARAFAQDLRARALRVVTLQQLRRRLHVARAIFRGSPSSQEDVALYERVLARGAADARRWGAAVVLVTIPSVETAQAAARGGEPSATYRRVLEAGRRAGYEVIDLLPALAASPGLGSMYAFPGNSSFAGAPHFSVRGAALAGREIRRALDAAAVARARASFAPGRVSP